jgi:hypothetical protein
LGDNPVTEVEAPRDYFGVVPVLVLVVLVHGEAAWGVLLDPGAHDGVDLLAGDLEVLLSRHGIRLA